MPEFASTEPSNMADVDRAAPPDVQDSDVSRSSSAHDSPLPTAALDASSKQQTARESTSDARDDTQDDSDTELAHHNDDFLDVVVTSADALDHTSASTATGVVASASSLLLLGLQEYTVELVVTKGAGSYCIRRPLSELLAVLQLQTSAPRPNALEQLPIADAPAFPFKQSTNDALIAKWCGEMTHFLAGATTACTRIARISVTRTRSHSQAHAIIYDSMAR